jgi:hypothetical protein
MGFVANSIETITSFDLISGGAAVETSEFTVWGLPSTVPGTESDWNGVLKKIADNSVAAWEADMDTSNFPQAMVFHGVKCRAVDAGGLTLFEQESVPSGTPWAGTDPNSMPWEVAAVVSLYSYTPGTFIPHGRRRRGRCYLGPMGMSSVAGDGPGYIKTASVTLLMNNFSSYLQDGPAFPVTSPISTRNDIGVFSRVDSHIYDLTDLRMNNKFDSQRRREKSLSEVWQTVAFP